ncbi:tetratricopeptide repeat protein [Pseudorhodoplanes sinuspersici]|uniref:Uncharacterized protein n=1 Tax=Pseudorhodoplanes sinuspersici TaxID=1235591 RepID=A0A1W6ZZ26_9HYPH|nr:tetratricopeptide repeat protein [Pseudorhodoplanes sinuspersici]ARQ02593.1 hypothetical protein CAK95_28400 [Pseudorhodoplanes sinuspersici]RKE74450.1 Flp pilus assembly protein TadD [Pseudorhodoplanes sinuspersici]
MNRKERRAAQKRGSPTASPMAATLASAFRAHQAGHRADAERLYRDVLMTEPGNAAALHLLGALLHQSGRTREGLSLIGQAVAIEPLNADYQYNFGLILASAGRLDEAASHLQKALVLNPKYAAAHFELGRLHAQGARWPEAAASFRQALTLKPNDAATLNNLGMVLREQGQLAEATTLWQRAISAASSYPLAHMNLGLAYQAQGKADDAIASLNRALELAPGNAEVTHNLAVALLNHGQHEQALQTIMRSLDKSASAELRALFVTCLTTMPRVPAEDRIRNLAARALVEGWSRPDQLASIATTILKNNPIMSRAVALVNQHWPRPVPVQEMLGPGGLAVIAQDELLAALLQSAPVADIELERVLAGLRFALLADARQSDGIASAEKVVRLSAALAQQCFLNGYVWVQSEDEANHVRELQKAVTAALENKQPVAPQWLTSIAAYVPLHALPIAGQLSKQTVGEPLTLLLDRQIKEPAEEAALRPSIQIIAKPSDTKTSDAPDDTPAPRWTAVTPQRPISVEAYLRRGFPDADVRTSDKNEPFDILIADCGTGQSAIEMAARHAGSNMLAIDPNAANLAYAARQARRLGQSAIGFAVCDDLSSVKQSFDVIDATGAMSKAANAEQTLVMLTSLLRTGGFMRVGIQGENLRRAIKSGQDFVRSGNYQSDQDGIRLLRQNILKLSEGHPARILSQRVEFYTTATCRDLLFRLQEPTVTLANAAMLLTKAGLAVIGFDIDTRIGDRYRARFPQDPRMTNFANWQSLESGEPDMAAMSYNVWVQKISS